MKTVTLTDEQHAMLLLAANRAREYFETVVASGRAELDSGRWNDTMVKVMRDSLANHEELLAKQRALIDALEGP